MSVGVLLCFSGLFYLVQFAAGQTCTYSLTLTNRQAKSNAFTEFTLQCKNSSGAFVPEAIFYRSGEVVANSTCLTVNQSLGNGQLRLSITPECDGYYSCGKNDITSTPIRVSADLAKNNTDRTIVAEFGKSVFLTCDFIASPIIEYNIRWAKGIGSFQKFVFTGEFKGLNIYNLSSSDQDVYQCLATPSIHDSPKITLKLIEGYSRPLITQDLKYIQSANANEFYVTTSGTNLSYSWYINWTLVNSTSRDIVAINEKSLRWRRTPSNSFIVTYEISNVDYTGVKHSVRQIYGVYTSNNCSSEAVEPSIGPGEVDCSSTFFEKPLGIGVLVILFVLLLAAIIVLLIYIFIIHFCSQILPKWCVSKQVKPSEQAQIQTDYQSFLTKVLEKSVDDLERLGALSSIMEGMSKLVSVEDSDTWNHLARIRSEVETCARNLKIKLNKNATCTNGPYCADGGKDEHSICNADDKKQVNELLDKIISSCA